MIFNVPRRTNPARSLYVVALAAAMTLAGCTNGPKVGTAPVAATSVQTVDAIVALLNQGDVKAARKRIKAALKRDPNNAALAVLQDSFTRDPVELLGPAHFEYVVKPGDTMLLLTERFLGNRLLSYQLARYNGIEKPASLVAGQRLRIPGQAPRTAVRPATPSPKPSVRPQPSRPPAPAAPAAPAIRTDPAAARQLRTQGLAALNKGSVAKAVQLLRRASKLDPGSVTIKTDLARAERIASTVRTRR